MHPGPLTLATRLVLAFAFVAALATLLVGYRVRDTSRGMIEGDFGSRFDAAASGVSQELGDLLQRACQHDTAVDKVHLALTAAKGDVKKLDFETWAFARYAMEEQAPIYLLDDLILVTDNGTILGAGSGTRKGGPATKKAADAGRIGAKDARLAALIKEPSGTPTLRPRGPGGELAIEVHCAKTSDNVTVGLVGSRRISGILERIGAAYRVRLEAIDPAAPVPQSNDDVEVKVVDFNEVKGLKVVASVTRDDLKRDIAQLDRSILLAGGAAIMVALLIALALARNLSRPIVALAHETREVVSGEPKHVRARGGREIAALAAAFNKTMDELTTMRKRLAATERIAARREVARQIAHEIKNPLAPIRAAVETLRRLRMRDDPAFDEYFEEATATVLGEVHRIANIVTEFTRFNRMPPPNPEPIDLVQVARGVVTLHASAPDGSESPATEGTRVELVAEAIPMVSADKDQIIQVLTNLIQNGLDAAS